MGRISARKNSALTSCWVGDGGTPADDGPAAGWGDLAERERALGLRDRQPILVSPDGRVDPRLSEVIRRSAFSAKAEGTQVTYAPVYRLSFNFEWHEAGDDLLLCRESPAEQGKLRSAVLTGSQGFSVCCALGVPARQRTPGE
ncbi:hypothetical protein ACFXO2_12710 [Streptomyces sp. NPDC059152]|uniref:hypothetical protein n=1 Tax=Streptomyces sp. NPDC059152 TaxID=3346742 RepID=UPI003685D84C